MKTLFATLNFILLFNVVHGCPDGDSSSACDTLMPSISSLTSEGSPTTHVSGQQYSRKTYNLFIIYAKYNFSTLLLS